MKTAKITSAVPGQPYESQYGTMHTQSVVLSDGTSGQVSAKIPNRWNVGEEVEYESFENQYGVRLKLSKPQPAGGKNFAKSPEDIKRITFLSCLSSACSFHAQSSTTKESVVETAKYFLSIAMNLDNQQQEPADQTQNNSKTGLPF